MKKVLLQFPNTGLLAKYILENDLSHAEAEGLTLTADLSEQLIVNACTVYDAVIAEMFVENDVLSQVFE